MNTAERRINIEGYLLRLTKLLVNISIRIKETIIQKVL
jgi:hypothetical protein